MHDESSIILLLIAIAEGDKPRIHIFNIGYFERGPEWTRVYSVDDSPLITAME